jgi:hypothetical protein
MHELKIRFRLGNFVRVNTKDFYAGCLGHTVDYEIIAGVGIFYKVRLEFDGRIIEVPEYALEIEHG